MSSHSAEKRANSQDNVSSLLTEAMREADQNVVTVNAELERSQAAVDHHREQVAMLRDALQALGVESLAPVARKNPESAEL